MILGMSGEALKGHLDLLLLAVLQPRPAHGYVIIEELRRRSGGAFDLPEGTIYPALHRLEDRGYLVSTWASEGRRRRRLYSLTRSGKAALNAELGRWRAFSGAVEGVLAT